MKHECMVMTLRLSSSRLGGSRQIHRGQKQRVKFATMSSECWSFFRHPRHCLQGIRTPWSNRQCQVLLWGFEVLERLREGIRRKRPDKLKNNNWFLHYDNDPAHTSLVVRQFLTSKNVTVIPHPSICLTSPPATFSCSPRWNYGWKGVFWHDWGDPRRIARCYRHTHILELAEMHEIMGNMLGLLYACPRGLLRRRRWKLGVR